tara:strand:+ start:32 stop:1432 length:1401 start_codon:yes stop_codon:yes gene_type:complete
MQLLKTEIKALIAFTRKPVFEDEKQCFYPNLKRFGIVLLLDLILLALTTVLFYVVYFFGLDEILKNNETIKLFNEFPLWLDALLIIVLIPIIEEFVFRFHLKYRRWVINIYLPIVLILTCSFLISLNSSIMSICIIIVCLLALIFYIVFNQKTTNYIERIWIRKFNLVFYITTLLFALIHITNYELSLTVILLAPILILPQFIGGFFIGYLRVKAGFIWGVTLHMASNAILMLPLIISLSTAFPAVSIQNKEYNLDIEKVASNYKYDDFQTISKDSITINSYSFKKCLSLLLDKEEKSIEFDDSFMATGLPQLKANILLRIEYKSKNKKVNDSLSSKKNILIELQKAYSFTLTTRRETKMLYRLYIQDSLKFNRNIESLNHDKSTLSTGENSVRISNGQVKGFISGLNDTYKKELMFYTNIDNGFRYSIDINRVPFKHLLSVLQKNYGLSFKKQEKNIEIINVTFE